ncbi:EAL domain-containing protein [Vibrio plantisponsor]|uniref:EAL domain-containing protein n=1 Tax=Vibrio plantisponsor TaxID=664643 RepID=A0ABU4ILW5_9VIBR|nr:EAL domain-containing protein [Vibrio plantisponsor]MDW6019558.1 EAL domain-containing protein [Vibrio plantisponsor]NNM39113.1 EAL domain-containing protein [Vibrio plantisponsor]
MDELIQRRFNNMFNSAVEGLWMMTPDGQVSFYNQRFYEQFDIDCQTTLDNWIQLIHPEDRKPFSSNVTTHVQAVGDNSRVITQYRVKKKDGNYIWIEGTGINQVDDSGEYMVGNHKDVTEQKKLEESIWQLAYFDKLTGLPNKDKLTLDLSKRTSSVTMVTIHFSGIKSYVSQYSEFILTDFIASLLECFHLFSRYECQCYRSSLDTFSVLIAEELSDEELGKLSNEFIHLFKTTTRNNVSYFGDAYIGIYVCRNCSLSSQEIINSSYQTCEYAVEKSKLNWVIYNDQVKPEVDKYFYVENHIKHAIENNEISIHLQPIVDAKSGQLKSFEALARWETEQFGFIPPDEFIPVAEALGLISLLGKKVFSKSAEFIVQYNQTWNCNLKVHVNISALQLLKETFPDKLLAITREKNAKPENLVLELTESVLIDNNQQVLEGLNELNTMGFPLAMDDFGSGYSSITSIFKLPFKLLKVDRELANQSLIESEAFEYLQFLSTLCENKKMEMTIEGIETQEMVEAFVRLNVCSYQGYLIAKPMPVDQAMMTDRLNNPIFN